MPRAILGLLVVATAGCSDSASFLSQIGLHPPGATAEPDLGEPESFPVGQPYTDQEFWAGVVPGGDNVEHYDSLAGMTRAADAVIVGRIAAIGTDTDRYKSIDLQGALFATLTIKVEQQVAGSATMVGPGQIDLAIFMTDPRQYDRFAAHLPPERALLFLRNSLVEARKEGWPPLPGDDHYYRVVSDQGALIEVADGTRSSLATDPFLEDIRGEPFDSVVALVESY